MRQPPMNLPGQLAIQLHAALKKDAAADRIALVWSQPPDEPEAEYETQGVRFRVVYCPSELALREQLVDYRPNGTRLVLLTPLDDTRLGQDVLARLWRHHPLRLSPWRTLQDLLGVREVDPRLTRQAWLAEALLGCFDQYRDRIGATAVLDAEQAWRALALALLGFDAPQNDIRSLMQWSLTPGVQARFAAAPEPVREHLGDWLALGALQYADLVLALFQAGHGDGLVAAGLVAQVLHHPALGESQEVFLARGRFAERFLGGRKIPLETLQAFAEEAGALVATLVATEMGVQAAAQVAAAEDTLAALDALELAAVSDLLPAGFELRLTGLAQAIQRALPSRQPEPVSGELKSRQAEPLRGVSQPPQAESPRGALTSRQADPLGGALTLPPVESLREALSAVQRHLRALAQPDRLERAAMAVRLAQWLLADRPLAGHDARETVQRFAAEGGFVDWARARIWAGDENEALDRAYRALTGRVVERREQASEVFGRQLAAVARGDAMGPAVLPVEALLEAVLTPLARHKPLLLVVMDGMSRAVFEELAEDLGRKQWIEYRESDVGGPRSLLSVLPTLTRFSRTSLLAGALVTGGAADEKRLFAQHAGLKGISSTRFPPLLFHKGDLSQAGGGGLAAPVRELVAGREHRVLAVVINAVDDWLDAGSQVAVHWTLNQMSLLRQLLEAAREAGRALVITSDHGHVVDHDMQYRPSEATAEWGEAGTRYRQQGATPATGEYEVAGTRYLEQGGTPTAGECEVTGVRVLTAGKRIVLPWSEKIRYGGNKLGYHGGGSLQEVAIPLGIFLGAADPEIPAGWRELARENPDWWQLGTEPRPVAGAEAKANVEAEAGLEGEKQRGPLAMAPVARRARPDPRSLGDLFETVPAEVTTSAFSPLSPALPREGGGSLKGCVTTAETTLSTTTGAAAGSATATGAKAAEAPPPDWVTDLLGSAIFAQQKARCGRVPIGDEQLAALLRALLRHGGQLAPTRLAQELNLPRARLGGFLAGVKRLLNLDGYPVLAEDRDSGRVSLNSELLKTQFQL